MKPEDLQFSNLLILRTPAISYDEFYWRLHSCLDMPFFRQAILLASPDLYSALEKTGFNIGQVSAKTRETLWKYWNRITHRPTPFGLFSAFSVIKWGSKPDPVYFTDSFKFHVLPDFHYAVDLSMNCPLQQIAQEFLCTNTAFYRVLDTFRFLNCEIDKASGKRKFHIDETDATDILEDLTSYCLEPRLFSDLVKRLCGQYDFSLEESIAYLNVANANGILRNTNSLINITGEDFCLRNGTALKKVKCLSDFYQFKNTKLYVCTERAMENQSLYDGYRQKIKEGLQCLVKLSPATTILEEFKKQFILKYDRQQVQLLKVLDPNTGLNYAMPVAAEKPSLLQVAWEEENIVEDGIMMEWTPVHELLMCKWLNNTGKHKPIFLTEKDMETIPATTTILPNSFSVLFRIINNTLLLEQAGGATCTALSGRFTPMNQSLCSELRKLADMEQEANPDVIFAEICHIEDLHTANIDRRETLYDYEIPILCGSLLRNDKQIPLSDLYISVSKDQVQLWSKQLNKRIIPRLSSAYNYHRSQLSIFRFLCDLQHEGLQSTLSCDLENYFPNQAYYPRIVYKDIIIQLATWIINEEHAQNITTLALSDRIAYLKDIAETQRWPRKISLNEHDHQLVFDTANEEDMIQLAHLTKTSKRMVIKEFLMDDKAHGLVKNEINQPFINQFIAIAHHKAEIYRHTQAYSPINSVQRIFIPGSEWLYYKLYLHPAISNEVLLQHISKCVHSLRVQGLLKKWFFVRYMDSGYHLRVRVHLHPKHNGYALSYFAKLLQELALSGIIKHFQIDTYERELERYSPEIIAECEDFFHGSTELIVAWFGKFNAGQASLEYYYIAIASVKIMVGSFGISDLSACRFFKARYEGFVSALGINKTDFLKQQFRAFNSNYVAYQAVTATSFARLKRQWNLFKTSITAITQKTTEWPELKKSTLLADLIHMHLNRLFLTDSRKQEMILYYCLWRLTESEIARKNLAGLPAALDQMGADIV